jgi:hypothetical protein
VNTDQEAEHSHALTEVEAALAALDARVTALEPTEPPPPIASATVASIPDLLAYLADDSLDEIVVTDGRYPVVGATYPLGLKQGLFINERYANRTRPILVRAETIGGVLLDGQGQSSWIGLLFSGGAHHQTWQGFRHVNGSPTTTGVIVFGGSGPASLTNKPGPHHITLLDHDIDKTCTDTRAQISHSHGVYISQSVGGVHDILIDRFTMDGSGGIGGALHFYHSTPTEQNAWNFTARNMRVVNPWLTAVYLWDPTLRNILIEDMEVVNASGYAVRYERPGSEIVLRRVITKSSKLRGFYSSLGASPPGLTFEECDFQ